jgi:tetratricopeptide (TPR) repeat protein
MSDEEKIESKFICVWLDNQLMKSEDDVDTQDQLETLVKIFRTFRNSDQCVDFITDITEQKIFFITTNILGKFLVPLIHSYEQIDSIYLFYSTKSTDNELIWTKDYKKIKEIFHDIKLIPNRFLQDTTEKQKNDPIAISFVSSVDINSNDLNRQDPTFMYFQLIKEILLNDHSSESYEETKNEMISFCRQIYVDNPNAIVILDEFEQSFIPELSIYWYTRECFLYKMLNKALWTPQPDVLYKLRYFIRHLYYQILSQAQTQRDQLSSMIVYRGQTMSADQINKLKQNVGGFLSFNNFLSTSLEKDVARNFLIGSEEIGVLFEMEIDPTIEKFPMINIELISYLKKEDCEQELLFAMGSVFRIIQIQQQENNLYRVQLKLSADNDQQLAEYTRRTREQTRTSHSFLSLLRLMNELSQYSCVDQFAEMLREDVTLSANPSILGAVHHMFGSIYHARGQLKKALDYFHKSLTIYLDFLPADHPTLTPTYNNIGSVYLSQSDFNKALEFQQLALDCQMKSENPNSSSIIIYTNNLAKIYSHQGKYKEALDYHKRALELQKQILGENDPSLTETYDLISSVYQRMNNYEQAGQFIIYSFD